MPSPRKRSKVDSPKPATSGRSSRASSRRGNDDIMEPPTPSTPGRSGSGSVRSTPRRGRGRQANGANGDVVPDSDGMSMPPTPAGRALPVPSPFTGGNKKILIACQLTAE